jgi:ABC-2 type transport system permease protein
MPLTSFEIMLSKVWAMGMVVLVAAGLSLRFVVQGVLEMPIAGSVPLYMFATALLLFSTTSLGVFLGTVARTMPQLGLLIILVFMPLQLLSGGSTPYESMPLTVQNLMLTAPTTHFVSIAQSILYRGAGLDVVWPNFLALIGIGVVFFAATLALFRKSLAAAS